MIELRNLSKRFGQHQAVDGITMEVGSGDFVALLGPSGCGKTTVLRLIAGLEEPDAGQLWIDGEEVTHRPPNLRPVNLVFQSYALFPHLTVAHNIGFGLKMMGRDKAEISRRVGEALELADLRGLDDRKPHEISGGQRQRVALARALVCRPKVLLLDEPLSALDAKLRTRMRLELKQLQQKVGITFILVTHDQEEAMAMANRVIVLNRGRIEQSGTPSEIYHQPRTAFVAEFVGEANLSPVEVLQSEGSQLRVRLYTDCDVWVNIQQPLPSSRRLLACVRPENIRIATEQPTGAAYVPAEVVQEMFRGGTSQVTLRTRNGDLLMANILKSAAVHENCRVGDLVYCSFSPQDVVLLPDA